MIPNRQQRSSSVAKPKRDTEQEEKQPQVEPEPVIRLRFEWSRGACRLLKRIHLPLKVLPRGEAKIDPRDHPLGFHVEGVDSRGDTIYRRSLVNPFRHGAEVFESDGRIHAVDHVPDSIVFDVMVPDRSEFHAVRLVANPHPFAPKLGARQTAAVEMISIAMREEDRPKRKERRHGKD
jgi:hypothetical protein